MFGVPHPSQRHVLTRGMGPVRCVSCARERSRMVQMLPSERRPCRIVGARPSQQGRDAPPFCHPAAVPHGKAAPKRSPPWSGVLSPTAVEGGASVAEAAEPFEVPLPAVLAHRIGGGVALPAPRVATALGKQHGGASQDGERMQRRGGTRIDGGQGGGDGRA